MKLSLDDFVKIRYHKCQGCGKIWQCARELNGEECYEPLDFGFCGPDCMVARLMRRSSIELISKDSKTN